MRNHPVIAFFIACILISFVWMAISGIRQQFTYLVSGYNPWEASEFLSQLTIGVMVMAVAVVFPFLITVVNLVGVFMGPKHTKVFHIFAGITLVGGVILTVQYFALGITNIVWKDWSEQLYNSELHFPLWSKGMVPLAVIVVLGILAYFILVFRRAYELPPLLIVFCMGAMYLWGIVCILWCVQLSVRISNELPLFALPINCIFLILREIRIKVLEWKSQAEVHAQKEWTGSWNRFLQKAELWPVIAIVAMLPILGVLICILALFGQAPDTLIRAFTETADWKLSEKVGPPNVYYDEHYLCTVAAGGDERIVKPLRMGERHGHRVIVNRQLQIANAFEQVLEERMPNGHRRIRHFYDTYGFPIACHIRTKRACDLVYLLMKPLEWFFLIVLYLTDVHPEDRIAVQYLPRRRA